MYQSDKAKVEDIVDYHGISRVIEMLYDICHEKADHVMTNWQDLRTANAWEKQAKELNKIIFHI